MMASARVKSMPARTRQHSPHLAIDLGPGVCGSENAQPLPVHLLKCMAGGAHPVRIHALDAGIRPGDDDRGRALLDRKRQHRMQPGTAKPG